MRASYSTYQVNVPQIRVDVDRVKVKQQDVQITDVFQTLQAYLGSAYVNDFNRFGRTYRVMIQADAQFRNDADDILALKVRNGAGEMVPLGSMVKLSQSYGPDFVERFKCIPFGGHHRRRIARPQFGREHRRRSRRY